MSFKAPQLLARQAMLAGLTPSIGGAAARGLFCGRAPACASARPERPVAPRNGQRRGSVNVRHPTYKHLEARLRLGAFHARAVGADHRRGTAAAVFGAYLSPLPTRVTIFVAILAAGLPVAVSYGAMGLEFSDRPVGHRRVALLAAAAPLPARRRQRRDRLPTAAPAA